MDLLLIRNNYTKDGVYGVLYQDPSRKILAHTLEHAYLDDNGNVFSKIPDGAYSCVRGKHRLSSSPVVFETFEITGIPNHTNILFHVGNYNRDSEGCVLLGLQVSMPQKMILNSKQAFSDFMSLQQDVDEFTLTVSSIS